MRRIGIDVGSTFTKYCIWDAALEKMELFSERTPSRQREYFTQKLIQLQTDYAESSIVSCGYGRKNVSFDKTVSELTALAAGAEHQCPGCSVVLDIGGQDTKLIRHEDGKLKAFFVNEKCAAGCGLFLGNTLNMLQWEFEKLDLTDAALPDLRLSSVCAVFAQSEIVELVAADVPEWEIIRAVLVQILMQARALLMKVNCSEIVLSGGLSCIPGIGHFAESILEKRILIPDNGAYLSAIGCTQMIL